MENWRFKLKFVWFQRVYTFSYIILGLIAFKKGLDYHIIELKFKIDMSIILHKKDLWIFENVYTYKFYNTYLYSSSRKRQRIVGFYIKYIAHNKIELGDTTFLFPIEDNCSNYGQFYSPFLIYSYHRVLKSIVHAITLQ